jgi:hypothetical protein
VELLAKRIDIARGVQYEKDKNADRKQDKYPDS